MDLRFGGLFPFLSPIHELCLDGFNDEEIIAIGLSICRRVVASVEEFQASRQDALHFSIRSKTIIVGCGVLMLAPLGKTPNHRPSMVSAKEHEAI